MYGAPICLAVLFLWLALPDSSGRSQSNFTFYQPSPKLNSVAPTTPPSYSQYYTQNLQQYHRPPVDIRNYTLDRYFYRNESISPYLNLARRPNIDSINNYYRYVRPEVERRSMNGVLNERPLPRFDSNPYFNQYYKPPY